MDTIFDGEVPRARLALLLRHFSELKDNREPWRIVYPLREVLLLVTCATIASCDDFDDIVAWGSLCGIRSLIHLDAFLRNTSAIINRSRTSSSTKSTFTGFGGTSVCGVRLITRMELKGPSLASRPRVLSLSAFFQNVACGSLAHSASEAPSSRCGPERAARARGCVVLLRPSTTL